MGKPLQRLKAFVKHPATQLVTGLVLITSGITEAILEFMSAEHSFRLGVHHGVALFGLIQVLGSLPDLIEGLEWTFEAIDKRQE